MKKVATKVVRIVVTLAVAACGGEAPQARAPSSGPAAPPGVAPPTAAEATRGPAKPLVELQEASRKALGEAFATGDAKKYAALFTENAVVKTGVSHEAVGREAIERSMAAFAKTFADATRTELRVLVIGEVVVSEWLMTATNSGDLMGFRATEKPVGVQGASIAWFTSEGLIKEQHVYFNHATVLAQAGIWKRDRPRAIAALPSGAPEVVIASESSQEKANMDLMANLGRSRAAQKADDLLALFADDASWDDLTFLAPSKGKKDIGKYVTTRFSAVPDGKLTTTNAWAAGDWVVDEGTFAGTHKGVMLGIAPSGKSFTVHELTVAKIGTEKKITSAVTYGDNLEIVAQLVPNEMPKPPNDRGAQQRR